MCPGQPAFRFAQGTACGVLRNPKFLRTFARPEGYREAGMIHQMVRRLAQFEVSLWNGLERNDSSLESTLPDLLRILSCICANVQNCCYSQTIQYLGTLPLQCVPLKRNA